MHRKLGKIGDLSISTSFMLNKLQKQAFRTIFSNTCYFSRTFGSLSKCSQFKSFLYCFGKCSFEPTEHIPLPNFWGWSPHYSDRFCDFFSGFLDIIRMSMLSVFLLAQLDSGICVLLCNVFLLCKCTRCF